MPERRKDSSPTSKKIWKRSHVYRHYVNSTQKRGGKKKKADGYKFRCRRVVVVDTFLTTQCHFLSKNMLPWKKISLFEPLVT